MGMTRRITRILAVSAALGAGLPVQGQHPEAAISNELIRAKIYLPDAEQGYYRDDRREGFWTKWNEDGRVSSQALFLNGKVVEVHRVPPWSSGMEDQDPPAELPVTESRREK